MEAQVLRDNTLTIHNANDVVQLWNKLGTKQTKAYSFCHLEELAPFTRVPKDDRPFLRIRDLMKMHEINFVDGGLFANQVSCHDCAINSGICDSCSVSQRYSVKPDKVQKVLAGWIDPDIGEDEHGHVDVEGLGYDQDLLEQADGEIDNDGELGYDEEDSGDEDDQIFKVGTIVWGLRYGRRLPAKIVCIDDIPMPRQRTLRTKRANICHVEYLGLQKYGNMDMNKLVVLGSTPQDHCWGEGNVNFLMALSQI